MKTENPVDQLSFKMTLFHDACCFYNRSASMGLSYILLVLTFLPLHTHVRNSFARWCPLYEIPTFLDMDIGHQGTLTHSDSLPREILRPWIGYEATCQLAFTWAL